MEFVILHPTDYMTFFTDNSSMDITSNESKEINKTLNYLNRAFPDKIAQLSNDSWIINLFILSSRLMKKYAMKNRENDLHDFFTTFWVEAEGLKKMEKKPSRFNIGQDFVLAMSSGTTGKDRIQVRLKTMEENFIKNYPDLELLDPTREFDRYEKAVIYQRDNGICQWPSCQKKVTWVDFEADHVRAWVKGGETKIENGQVLCKPHNRKKSDS